MSEENPPPLPPRSVFRHLPDHNSAMQQQDLPLWHSLSQPQQAPGVQAVPVGIGFANRPQQQQLWQEHTPAAAYQRGWQPFPQPHTQQSPQESQELNPQVVRSQPQNWLGDMNTLQLQQLQQLVYLQQHQQLQQQQLQQQQQQHHQNEQALHHSESVTPQHEEPVHDKFTKSPSPQIEENRHSPSINRQYVQNVTSPQQQMWPHHQMVHQYEIPHAETPHSQAYQHTPAVSHHQPLFTQQQYMQPVWPHTPFSQVALQHVRQNTPQLQQHLLWQQQQQQQLHQHQLQQQQQQQHQQQQSHSDPPPPYSPPSSNNFIDKPVIPEKKDTLENKNDVSSFLNSGNRIGADTILSKNQTEKAKLSETHSGMSITPATSSLGLNQSNNNSNTTPAHPIRILSKSNQNNQNNELFGIQEQKSKEQPSLTPATTITATYSAASPQPVTQRPGPVSAFGGGSPHRPQSFNPHPSSNPYQTLNPQNMYNKGFQGLYGSQNRFPAPNRETSFNQGVGNQYRPRSPLIHHQQPPAMGSLFQRNAHVPPHGPNFNRMEQIDTYILVQGLNPRTSGETIKHYFEAIARPAEVKDNVIFSVDHTEALVTFIHKPDLYKLKQTVKNRKLDSYSPEVYEVPAPTAIVVTSDVPLHHPDQMIQYFERESIGGGSVKKDKLDETEDGCTVIEFGDSKVVQRLCATGRQHRVNGVFLRVSPYYQCTNGSIWDSSIHVLPIPKPVNIQILPDQLEFVKRYCQPLFAAKLRDRYADVSFSKDHVTIRCTLRQTLHNYRTLVRSWETDIQEVVAKFLREYIDQADITVPEVIWDKFLEWMNPGKASHKDILVKIDRDKKNLKLVGLKVPVRNFLQNINQKLEILVRAARRESKSRKLKSEEQLLVLEIQGTFTAICKKFQDLKIHVEGMEVTVEGDPDDIPTAFIEIFSECEKVEPKVYKHRRSRECVDFMRKDSSKRFIQRKIDQKLLKGSWKATNLDLYIYTSKSGNPEGIRDVILRSVTEEVIEIERPSADLFNSEIWAEFLLDKKKRYKDKVEICTKKNQSVLVVGTDDVMHNVLQQVQDFLEEKTVKTVLISLEPVTLEFISECWTPEDYADIQSCDVTVKVKSNGLDFTGLSDKINAAKLKLEMKLKRMCSKKHLLKRTGIYEVLESSKHSGMLSAIEKECKCIIKLPKELESAISQNVADYEVIDAQPVENDTNSSSGAKLFQTKRHKIKIHLVQGELGTQTADVIVCSASSTLNLKSCSATFSLFRHGGNQLQNECTKMFPEGVKHGEVAVISSGNLNCDKVYLTSLPPWKEAVHNGGKIMKDFLRECLRLADKYSKKTLAFHAMGTGGFLGYPKDVVASIMYGVIVEYDKSYNSTGIRDINFVLHNKDTETVKAFEDHEHIRIYGSSGAGTLSDDFVRGRIKIEMVVGDLSQQKVDAMFCSVPTDMNLSRSLVCKSLLEHGGRSLQEECKQKHDNELEVGTVVEISSGKLGCKMLLLTALPKYSESNAGNGEPNMMDIIQTGLQLANTKGYKSIALPALGTGYLNYPKSTAAKMMYDAVLDWSAKTPKASLKLVQFVIYSKDTESQQAFRLVHHRCLGREARSNRSFYGDGTIIDKQTGDSVYRMLTEGCVIGPARLTVQIGDILSNTAEAIVNGVGQNFDMSGSIAQALVKKCPNILPECQQKKAELRKDGVVITSGSGLQTDYIVHVLFQDTLSGWRSKMVACLEEANKKRIKSVAFPVLGAGAGTKSFLPSSIAETLFMAVDDFVSKHPKSSIDDVFLVIHPQNQSVKPSIMSALQDKTTAAISQTPIGRWIKSFGAKVADKIGLNIHQGLQTPTTRQKMMTEMSAIQVTVYSDAIINIDRCIKALEDRIGLEYCRKVFDIGDTTVKSLTDKQLENMVDPNILVDVRFDKKQGKYILSGSSRNVLLGIESIQDKLQQYEREQHNRGMAETLYNQVRWHYEEVTALERREKPYSLMPNYMIETAYSDGKSTIELKDCSGKEYIIDFLTLEEYSKQNRADSVRVIRKDILKGAQAPLPNTWMTMSNNELVKKVSLPSSDKEYTSIEKLFLNQVKTGQYSSKVKNKQNVKVLKIERIQNRTLFQQYSVKKKQMENQKPNCKQRERQLWHGTSEDSLTSIISNGFNRSYCGVHGSLYGAGVYFTKDASYSVQSNLVGQKQGNNRYMFVVKALTGEIVQGTSSMRVLPPVNSSSPTLLYDCAVDDVNNPMEFVIFHDTQAYPEYLITFTS